MPKPITIFDFGGKYPRLQPEMLPANGAQEAVNCDFSAGGLKPFKDLKSIATLTGGTVTDSALVDVTDSALEVVTIGQANFMYPITASDGTVLWLGLVNNNLDIIPSSISDSDGRFYYTGDGLPSQSDYTLANTGTVPPYPGTFYRLGVPAPTAALTLTLTDAGAGSNVVSTAYVYTYVTVWGEESAPSPASANIDVDWVDGDSIELDNFLLPTDTDLNIDAIRIYRINSGTATSEFQFVIEVACDNTLGTEEIDGTPVASYTYDDSALDGDLGEAISTAGWLEPPTTMQGLALINGGSLAGFVDNTLYISEPYFPYAWPTAYSVDLPSNIVGISAALGRTYILTEGNPYFASGNDPATFIPQALPYPQPCVSKRSIVPTDMGVIYASQEGLFMLRGDQGTVLTEEIYDEQNWRELDITNINGTYHNGSYYGIFQGSKNGFIYDLSSKKWTDIKLEDYTFTYIMTDGTYVYVTALEDSTYVYSSYAWDEGTGLLPLNWKSRIFKGASSHTHTAGRVFTNGTTYLKYWQDGQLNHIEIANEDVFRLPASRAYEIEIGIEGKADVQGVLIGGSVQEISND